jgi:hypothetical protein
LHSANLLLGSTEHLLGRLFNYNHYHRSCSRGRRLPLA